MQCRFKIYKDVRFEEVTIYESLPAALLWIVVMLLPIFYFRWLSNIGFIQIPDWVVLAIIWMGICLLFYYYNFETEKEHTKRDIGEIIFTPDNLIWNDEQLNWSEITVHKLHCKDYKGKQWKERLKSRGFLMHTKSSGLSNKIEFSYKEQMYQANFLIESKKDSVYLKNLLWEILKNNRLAHEQAKRIINPANYKEHQKIKKYIG